MNLELVQSSKTDLKETIYTVIIKDVDRQNWKDMTIDVFRQVIEHPKMDVTAVAKLIMGHLGDKYKEVEALKSQLADKIILEDDYKKPTNKP